MRLLVFNTHVAPKILGCGTIPMVFKVVLAASNLNKYRGIGTLVFKLKVASNMLGRGSRILGFKQCLAAPNL
jgi:hypothetical protein